MPMDVEGFVCFFSSYECDRLAEILIKCVCKGADGKYIKKGKPTNLYLIGFVTYSSKSVCSDYI